MATRTLNVPITGDAKDFKRAVKGADNQLERLERTGRKSLGSLKTGMLAVGAAATAGVVVGLKKSAEAAIESEKANARLRAQLKALGISYSTHEKQIQRVIDRHSQLSGLDDEDLGDSFTNIVRVTGDVNQALRLNVIAMDFARAKHIEVAKAGELVGKVAGGNTGILGRYGITIDKNATATEALGLLQQKFAGQAEAYGKTTAGASDRANVALENLGETVGAKITPLLAKAAEAFSTFIRQMTLGEGPGGRVRAVLEGIGSSAASVYGDMRNLVTGFQEGATGARTLAATLAGVAGGFAAFKILSTVAAAITAVRAAWTALTVAVAANPIGALIVVLGAAAAALGVLSVKTKQTTIDARDFNDAMRAQADALRAVRDIDIDVSQRRATLASATVGVAQAEKRLKDVRKDGNSTTLDVKQAEADLRQARVSQKRAQRDLNDVEEDSTRKRDALTDATGKVRGEQNSYNAAINRTIQQKEGELKSLTASAGRYGTLRSRVGSTRDAMEAAREKAEKLRAEIAQLKSRKITVGINLELIANDPSLRLTKKFPSGDGIGSAVRSLVKTTAQAGGLALSGFGGGGSGALKGARPSLAPFAAIGSRFGLSVSSGLRPGSITSSGNQSYHSSGEAIDESGSPGGMLGFFNFMKAAFGNRLAELIYTPGGTGIKDGRPYRYGGQVAADHYDHVHVAFDTGRPGVGDGHGRPRMGDGIGQIKNLWIRAGGSKSAAPVAAAVAMAESTGDPSAHHTNSDGSTDRGLWQINSVHGALSTFNRLRNAKAAIRISGNGRNWSPWTTFTSGAYKKFLTTATAGGDGGSSSSSAPQLSRGGSVVGRAGNTAAGIGSTHEGGPNEPLLGPGQGGYEQQLADVSVRRGTAEGRNDLGGLITAIQDELRIKRRRIKKIRRALKRHLRKATRLRLTQELGTLIGDVKELASTLKEYRADARGGATTISEAEQLEAGVDPNAPEAPEAPTAPTPLDFLDAAVANAALTPGTGDDLAAAIARRDYFQGVYNAALATPDPRDDIEAAQNLSAAIEAVNALTEATTAANRIAEERAAIEKELVTNQQAILALTKSQGPQLIAGLAAILSGGIGGKVALGFQTPGFAGTAGGIRY